MGDPDELVHLGAQAAEALVWLALTFWCLERMRTHLWARLAALGGVAMLVPAVTLTAARAQLALAGDSTILENYVLGPLPTTYAVLRVAGAVLLLLAVTRRRPAPAFAPIADASRS